MNKKYIVRLSDAARESAIPIVKRLSGTRQKVRRAQILPKTDANVPNWPDSQITSAYRCRIRMSGPKIRILLSFVWTSSLFN